mgnify:FL=1|tara:strand:- start:115 stop:651 length:537 start_codon:yes stop_codon:yes gene_type:complete
MGLKQDIIDAKVEGLKASGADEEKIDTSNGSHIEVESELIKEAIVNFLTSCEFRITRLNANVVVENFNIPDQPVDLQPNTLLGDKAPIIDTIKKIPGIGTIAEPLEQALKTATQPLLKGGSTLPSLQVDKDAGGLNSTGYVFIGSDPDSQDSFDVEDEDGQRQFTTVKLIREDIEELL